MKRLADLLNEEDDSQPRPISWGELKHVEHYLDQVWKHLDIDFEFTKHFFERVNDPRNKRQISARELVKIFTEVYKQYGKLIASKVTPESEKKFDSVLTDLSTKVNSPVVVVWDKDAKELKMIAKTVMRVNHFYAHDNQPRLTVQHFEPQGTPITENEMKQKTYSDLKEWLGWNTPEVAPIAAPQAVDDVDNAAFSVEQPDNLDKLNAYCHDIANHQYNNPYYPLNTLWKKLHLIGINFDLKKVMFVGEHGKVEVPLSQWGGRFGVLNAPFSDHIGTDDGISHRIPGGLKLAITYVKTGGVYTLDAKIEHGANTMGFVEGVVAEDQKNCTLCGQRQKAGEFCPCTRPTPVKSKLHGVADQPKPKAVTEEDYNLHTDCGNCGREGVWVNRKGVCQDCVSKQPPKPQQVKKK